MSQLIILSPQEICELVESSVYRALGIALQDAGVLSHDAELTELECAQLLKIKPATLRQWRSQKRGPRFRKIGRNVRYCREDVDAWRAQQSRETAESMDLNAMTDRVLEANRGKKRLS